MQDYEWAGLQRKLSWRVARRVIVPDAIPVERLVAAGAAEREAVPLPGAEGGLLPGGLRARPGGPRRARPRHASDDTVLVVVRPPPETSAYHADNPLYDGVIDRLAAEDGVVAVVIPRTEGQAAALRARGEPSLIVPARAIDAQSLIGLADLVVSAGGTMNREAVALGTPVYTIFSGRMGAVDERLIERRAAARAHRRRRARAAQADGPARRSRDPRSGAARRRRPRRRRDLAPRCSSTAARRTSTRCWRSSSPRSSPGCSSRSPSGSPGSSAPSTIRTSAASTATRRRGSAGSRSSSASRSRSSSSCPGPSRRRRCSPAPS